MSEIIRVSRFSYNFFILFFYNFELCDHLCLEFNLSVHADLDEPVVLDANLDCIDQIGTLIVGQDGLWGKFRTTGDPRNRAVVLLLLPMPK